jgi:3-dehydroshikimate dehydratase
MERRAADRIGLCSVTLRAQTAEEVLDAAAASGLAAIEWGADRHAPPDHPALADLGQQTKAHGLSVCSYGSYWRAGVSPVPDMSGVARAARSLGTTRIRIWAGQTGSADTSPQDRATTVAAVRSAADVAADFGCNLAFEFHGNTLTDTVDSTLRLLEEVDRPNVSTYWQPPIDVPDDEAVAGLRRLVDRVSAIHVFSWWPGQNRLPLLERAGLWRRVIDLLHQEGSSADLLLEFVPDDDPKLVSREASTLRVLATEAVG